MNHCDRSPADEAGSADRTSRRAFLKGLGALTAGGLGLTTATNVGSSQSYPRVFLGERTAITEMNAELSFGRSQGGSYWWSESWTNASRKWATTHVTSAGYQGEITTTALVGSNFSLLGTGSRIAQVTGNGLLAPIVDITTPRYGSGYYNPEELRNAAVSSHSVRLNQGDYARNLVDLVVYEWETGTPLVYTRLYSHGLLDPIVRYHWFPFTSPAFVATAGRNYGVYLKITSTLRTTLMGGWAFIRAHFTDFTVHFG